MLNFNTSIGIKLFGYNIGINQTYKNLRFMYLFDLYFYPSDWRESDRCASRPHKASKYPRLLPKMPRYWCPVGIHSIDLGSIGIVI